MSEQTLQVILPSGIAEAFVSSLERLLKEAGFEESLKAGEVGGVETSFWQHGDAQVVVILHESETEETLSISSKGVNGAEVVKVAGIRLALELLEGLPAEIRRTLEPILPQLREHATCPNDQQPVT